MGRINCSHGRRQAKYTFLISRQAKNRSCIQTDLGEISSLRFSAKGNQLIAGSTDGSVFVFNVLTRKQIAAILKLHKENIGHQKLLAFQGKRGSEDEVEVSSTSSLAETKKSWWKVW